MSDPKVESPDGHHVATAKGESISGAETFLYNPEKEKNVTNTIFGNNNLYCFQVSSWNKKEVAASEVDKLIQKGHNAFFVKARPSNKKGIWYRVRIGYFSNLDETAAYERKIKK